MFFQTYRTGPFPTGFYWTVPSFGQLPWPTMWLRSRISPGASILRGRHVSSRPVAAGLSRSGAMFCRKTRGFWVREMGKNGSCWKMPCLVTQEGKFSEFEGNLYISGEADIKWHLFWRIIPVDVSGWQPWLVLSRKDRVVDPFPNGLSTAEV